MSAFSELPLAPELLAVIAELGFAELTPIQKEAIPLLLSGRDLVGRARTGSGKTAAFALPLLHRLSLATRRVRALVLCPTRELATQVARELRRFGRRYPGLTVLVLAGGEPIGRQIGALERGVHVAVGTPGRVLDHLRRRTLDLSAVSSVVLDEADRMLDLGFGEDVLQILEALPDERQTAFFSATYPPTIAALARKYQRDPAFVEADSEPEQAPEIEQLLVQVEPEQKLVALHAVLGERAYESALVFANLKATVAEVARSLAESGLSADSLHGDLEQFERDRVLAKFRNGSTRVLVATDVAARGIDILDLDLVVNFDLPPRPEVYVHRIGRTGRAGKTGLAISLASEREHFKLEGIAKLTGKTLTTFVPTLTPTAADRAPTQAAAKMATLRISGGRKEKVRPGDILGALTGEAGGFVATDIGKIEIFDHHAYVAVKSEIRERAQQSLSRGRIKGRKFLITFED